MSAHLAGITAPIYARPTAAPPHRAPPPAARARGAAAIVSTEDLTSFRSGVKAERARWARVLASSAFTGAPVAGAHLLAVTDMSAGDIIGSLRQIAADEKAAPREHAAAIADRWSAAFQHMRAAAASSDGPRPPQDAIQRWSAAFKRAGGG